MGGGSGCIVERIMAGRKSLLMIDSGWKRSESFVWNTGFAFV
jgi:hypothetical protein